MTRTVVERYGPIAPEDAEYITGEVIPQEMDGDDQVKGYQIAGVVAHEHTESCRDWGGAARGDYECSAEYERDVLLLVTRCYV